VKFGNAPLDRQLGGLLPARPYLLSGGPGSGKSVSCLEFLDVAVQQGEVGVLLTHDDPADVLSSAAFLGIDAEQALGDGRLVILRFQLDFVRRFGRAATPDDAFAELRRLMGDRPPARLAIDSVMPFLEGGGAGSTAIFALTNFLEQLGATTLITYPGDLSGLYDRRLEPLMQRAGGFFHLSSLAQGRRRGVLEIRKLRFEATSVAPVQFIIQPGAGFVQDGAPNEPEQQTLEEIRRRLLVVNMGAPFPDELLRTLGRQFEVTVRSGVSSAFSDLVRAGVGAVLLNVQRDVIRDALELVREMRRSDVRTPIVMVTPYVLRSSDRTRALRAGADDFMPLNTQHNEFVTRMQSITRRGRSTARVESESERPLIAQPQDAAGRYEVLSAERFSTAVASYLSLAQAPFFTLLHLCPEDGDIAALAALATETSRIDSGDLVGYAQGGVVLFADGARPKELEGLEARLREKWAAEHEGGLAIEATGFPADEERIRARYNLRSA
jgi:KaiC/GvpD/RAD55 family RecA-like ATPase/DNA-binding response OmpR family regulator